MNEVVTLQQILDNREARVDFQKILLRGYGSSLVCFTVNMPGAIKRCAPALAVHRAGVAALRERLAGYVIYYKTLDYPTGYEAYFAVDLPAEELKTILVQLEETHPMGRLMDLDVLRPDGTSVSRSALGLPRRKCLLCDGDAKACGRSQAHSLEDLWAEIARITGEVFP
jgi:holo-ACP synthase